MQLTEVEKQVLAAHQLEGTARFWWNSLIPDLDVTEVIWVEFQTRFEGRFVPATVMEQLAWGS